MGSREQVEPHCQHLPELDPGAAEVLQRKTKLNRIEAAMAPGKCREEDAVTNEDSDRLRGTCQRASGRDQPAPLHDRQRD